MLSSVTDFLDEEVKKLGADGAKVEAKVAESTADLVDSLGDDFKELAKKVRVHFGLEEPEPAQETEEGS